MFFLPALGWEYFSLLFRNFPRINNIFIPNLTGKHNVGQIHHPLKSLEASCWLLFPLLIWSFSGRWEIDEAVTETLVLSLRNNRAFHECCRAACQSFGRAALKNIQQLLGVLKSLGGGDFKYSGRSRPQLWGRAQKSKWPKIKLVEVSWSHLVLLRN